MDLTDLVNYTDSPIERILAQSIASAFADFEKANVRLAAVEPREFASLFALPANSPACIIPQAQIDLGDTRYRVDFLLLCGPKPISRRVFAVECDGHEWHEKTKEQVARDKLRDRRLLGDLGIPTVRFAGSEIVADPATCAEYLRSLVHGATGFALYQNYQSAKDGATR